MPGLAHFLWGVVVSVQRRSEVSKLASTPKRSGSTDLITTKYAARQTYLLADNTTAEVRPCSATAARHRRATSSPGVRGAFGVW